MGEGFTLINVGDLSKPATALVEKIGEALGGAVRPWQIRRVAAAEADATKIHALAQIEVDALRQRAASRVAAEQVKHQANIEAVTAKAIPQLNEAADPKSIDNDWLASFFDKCRLVSDEEMQSLWSRVLAGEANVPGKYSRRVLSLLADIDKGFANAFTQLCCFCFRFGTTELLPLVYNEEDTIYANNGVSFGVLAELESLGLVRFDSLAGFERTGLGKEGNIFYFGTPVWIGFAAERDNRMKLGRVLLTNAGSQLAPICGASPRAGFVEYVRQKWISHGYRTNPVVDASASAGS